MKQKESSRNSHEARCWVLLFKAPRVPFVAVMKFPPESAAHAAGAIMTHRGTSPNTPKTCRNCSNHHGTECSPCTSEEGLVSLIGTPSDTLRASVLPNEEAEEFLQLRFLQSCWGNKFRFAETHEVIPHKQLGLHHLCVKAISQGCVDRFLPAEFLTQRT